MIERRNVAAVNKRRVSNFMNIERIKVKVLNVMVLHLFTYMHDRKRRSDPPLSFGWSMSFIGSLSSL